MRWIETIRLLPKAEYVIYILYAKQECLSILDNACNVNPKGKKRRLIFLILTGFFIGGESGEAPGAFTSSAHSTHPDLVLLGRLQF